VAPPLAPATPLRDPAAAAQPPFTRRIAEVVEHGSELWVRGADGTLASMALPRGELRRHFAGTSVTDLHLATDRSLWVLAADAVTGDARVWKRAAQGWEPVFEMGGPSTPLLALGELRARPVVLTRRAVFVPGAAGAFEGIAMERELRPGRVPQVHFVTVAPGLGYVGTNDGEHGGALHRVDLADGSVELLRRVDGPGLCDGPLNPGCDPVTAVIEDRQRRGCVLVGVGLVHMATRGRLLRVCDRAISVVWQARRASPEVRDHLAALRPLLGGSLEAEQDSCRLDPAACDAHDPCASDPSRCGDAPSGSSRGMEAVLALSAASDGLWMVTDAASYRFRGGRMERHDLPPLTAHGGIALGELPGARIVATDAHAAASLSGFTALVTATAEPGRDEAAPPAGSCWQVVPASERPQRVTSPDAEASDEPPAPAAREELTLCFEADRSLVRLAERWSSVQLAWHRRGGGWEMALAGGVTLRASFAGDAAIIRRRAGRLTYVADLRRLSEEAARALRSSVP
jgi:hypothetical protein